MKKSFIRTFVLLAVVFCCALVASCGGSGDDPSTGTTYTITFNLNGGTMTSQLNSYDGSADITLPTPKKSGSDFAGWYEKADFSGNVVTKIAKGSTGNKVFYAKWTASTSDGTARWELNQIGFQGNGMKFGIKCLPVSEFDPTAADFSGDPQDKPLLQAHLGAVESAYGIDIQYVAYGDDEAWGPTRVKAINDSFIDQSYLNEGIYVVNISTQWIPTLNKGGSLAGLYNTSQDTGFFKNVGYVQNTAINQSVTVNKVAYGYAPGAARPDYFLYYNVDYTALLNLEDPAELWLKGEWTWDKFDSWVKEAQGKLKEGEFAIDCGYAEFSIGAVAALGNQMIDSKGKILFTRSAVTEVFDQMQAYYRNNYWDKAHGVQDVATNFKLGKTLIHTGSIWFLKEPTRFTPAEMDGGIQFKIGTVPYPMADGQEVTIYTEPYEYIDTQGNTVEVTEPIIGRDKEPLKDAAGNDIYGVDYTSTTFKMPYTGGTCYSFMNFDNTPSGMTAEIAFNVMYDLVSGIKENPVYAGVTADQRYEITLKKKFDDAIDIDVVMSVQNDGLSYYELMEVASMTVGDGSHFGNGYWQFCAGLITGNDTPKVKLDEVKGLYEDALIQIGIY